MIGRVLARTTNPVAVPATSPPATPRPLDGVDRPRATRRGSCSRPPASPTPRVDRVTGKADRGPVVDDPAAPRNRRVEITLLRRFPKTE